MNTTQITPRTVRPTETRRPRRTLVRIAGLAVLGGVAGFAAFAVIGAQAGSTPAEAAAVESAVDHDDIDFAQCMTPHHEQAVQMSVWALDPAAGARPEVVDLARRIHDVQTVEIAMMADWLDAWGEPVESTSMGHDVSLMSGMQGDEAMARLHASTGAEFDRLWLEMMITHHRGGITMSRHAVADGTDPAVRAAAEEMIAAQTAEIAEMEALLGR